MESKKTNSNIWIIIICCIFVAGITLLGAYLFTPGAFDAISSSLDEPSQDIETRNNTIPLQPENNQNNVPTPPDIGLAENNDVTDDDNQNATPTQPDFGLAENPENRPRADVPYDPNTGGRVSGRVSDDGTGQWSTDGGKTWSDTPPEGLSEKNHNDP